MSSKPTPPCVRALDADGAEGPVCPNCNVFLSDPPAPRFHKIRHPDGKSDLFIEDRTGKAYLADRTRVAEYDAVPRARCPECGGPLEVVA